VRHDEHGAGLGPEVARPPPPRMSQPEDPLLAEGDGHDQGPADHLLDAVVVRPDAVTEAAVVPVHQQPMESVVDRPAGPVLERIQLGRDGQGGVSPARVVVIDAVGLLPAGVSTGRPCIRMTW
jgi:hypothetical protein